MSRVPLISEETCSPAASRLLTDVRTWLFGMPGPRGKAGPLPETWLVAAHSPAFGRLMFDQARYYLSLSPFLGANPRVRQICILTVGSDLRCHFVIEGHWPLCAKIGMSRAEYDAALDVSVSAASPLFSSKERAAIGLARSIASGDRLTDIEFDRIENHYDVAELVDLTGLCGFFVALCTYINTFHISH